MAQEHLRTRLGARDGIEPGEAAQTAVGLPQRAVDLRILRETHDLVRVGRVLEQRVELALLHILERGVQAAVEQHRQEFFERRAGEGARIVGLARLHDQAAAALDELAQRCQEFVATRRIG